MGAALRKNESRAELPLQHIVFLSDHVNFKQYPSIHLQHATRSTPVFHSWLFYAKFISEQPNQIFPTKQ